LKSLRNSLKKQRLLKILLELKKKLMRLKLRQSVTSVVELSSLQKPNLATQKASSAKF
jgi:hypothetical protein